jgi:hypothetical protein
MDRGRLNRLLNFMDLWFKEALGKPMFSYQKDLSQRSIVERRSVLIVKARQTGISTWSAFSAVSEAVFEGWPVLITSNREENAAHILEYATVAWEALERFPISLPRMTTDRKTRLAWDNGGEIRCLAANPSTARGFPAKRVYFDEFAHFRGEAELDKKMLSAVGPSLSQLGGWATILSTPFGMANEFARMWHSPDTPPESKFVIHWRDCPTLKVRVEEQAHGKQYWIEGMPAPFPEDVFKQEFEGHFDPGAGLAIPADAIYARENVVGDEEAWG